ncbi:MAG: DNA starvation/stationary phase protection protein [Chitinophagaceae bacterium]|nr:DNA starvation/stationary phase protection protein [Chitinophagaceae bacterium]
MKPNIEISENNLKEVATLLNNLVADEYVLYTKTRNAHWNIEGPGFMDLHKFFEAQYEALDLIIDEVAERVRALGHYSLGSLKDFLSMTHLTEGHNDFSKQKQVIQSLLNDHETIIRILRKDIHTITEKCKDSGTGDFVTGIMEQHEKMSWMLRAYLI